MQSVCVDAHGRITGVCPDDLTGGPGWTWVECELTPVHELTDERGIALYKLVGGVVVARTAKEIESDAPEPVMHEPTVEERLAAVEAATLDLILGGAL